MSSEVFSKVVIKGGKTKEQSQMEKLYDHMKEEFRIEVLLDQMIAEGYGEKLLFLLSQKMKKLKKHRYHKKVFPRDQDDFESRPKKHKKHKKKQDKSWELLDKVDPLWEIYNNVPLDESLEDAS